MINEVQRYVTEYHDWFYLITVVWTFLEGETFVILAAAVASQGLLDPVKLGICACLGSYAGDQCWFLLGRHFGHILMRRYPKWRSGIQRVHDWLEHWDVLFILTFRFIYGIRNFSAAAMGLSELNAYRFMVLNFISAVIWATVFVSVGYWGGRGIEGLLGDWAEDIELAFLGLFVAVITAIWLAIRWRARRVRHERTSAKAATIPPAPSRG